MLIKIISTQVRATNVDGREFVAEANQYLLQKLHFDNQEDMWEYLQDFGDYYSPFNLDIKGKGREVMILQITEPAHSTIVVTACHVFVMNKNGKTIDRFSIASDLQEANE